MECVTTRSLTIAILACAVVLGCHRRRYYEAPKLVGVSFEAYSAFRGPSLDTVGISSRMVTTEDAPPTLQWGACGPTAKFERVSGDSRQHRQWSSYEWQQAEARKHGMVFACLAMLSQGPITPEMKQNRLAFSVATKDVLGDSLPAGRYKITLQLPVVGSQPIPAGFLELRSPPTNEQSEVAHQLVAGDISETGRALSRVRKIGPDKVGPELRAALMTALERENALVDNVRTRRAAGEKVVDSGNPELAAGLALVVSSLRDPAAIHALAGSLGSSPPAISALAEFGEAAAPAVLDVLETTTNVSVAHDALLALRFMVEGVGGSALSQATRERIARAATSRLTGPQQSITTVWRAIDLAVALRDPALMRIVQSLASDRSAVVKLRDASADLIEQTQRIAVDRLRGVPPLPRHTSVEDFARRW